MHPILNIAVRAIRKASNFLTERYEKIDVINPQRNFSMISHMLKLARKIIIDVIHQAYPDHAIYSEYLEEDSEIQWIITSLDGVINFGKKFPHFSISVAVRIKNRTEIAVIYDFMRNELFTAARGQGSQLNAYRLRRSTFDRTINNMIVGTEYSSKMYHKDGDAYIKLVHKMIVQGAEIRSTGARILDLAYVAAGRMDGYFIMGVSMEEIAAGMLIICEAGGLVADFNGGHNYLKKDNFVAASTPRNLRALLKFLVNNY
ncbi:MAG: inositol monophosphatase family protein [Candidatus Dasytiphilus stammeri]